MLQAGLDLLCREYIRSVTGSYKQEMLNVGLLCKGFGESSNI